ncbi:MAG: DUF4867 family protein [bacterium]|nr:DUF4867 family protein [bacterium]
MLEKLRKLNPDLNIKSTEDKSFKKYGRLINGYDFSRINNFMGKSSELPATGNIYKASVSEMELDDLKESLSKTFYGKMPIQIGYCNGQNTKLNGLEYHKGSEINYAVTDMVLLVGNIWQIENNSFDSNDVEAFFVSKGTTLEIYATTLHFAPCKVHEEGFKCVVILPEKTNCPLNEKTEIITAEDELLFMSNKWLIVHKEAEKLVNNGAYIGIRGNNINLNI